MTRATPGVDSQRTDDLRTQLPEMVRIIRRHHYLPHGYVLAAVHGVRTGWTMLPDLPAGLKNSFRFSMGICLALAAVQCVCLGFISGPKNGALVLATTVVWNLSLFPLLYSQLPLVRSPETGQHFPRFGLPNLLTLYRLSHLPVLLLATMFLVRDHGASGEPAHPMLLLLYISVALSDLLDGLAARRLHLVSDFGRVYDPVCDILVFVSCSVGFFLADLLPVGLLIVVLLRFGIPFLGSAFLYAYVGPFRIQPTVTGKLAVFLLGSYLGLLLLQACTFAPVCGALCQVLMWGAGTALSLHAVLTLARGLRMIRTASGAAPEVLAP